MHSAPMQGTPFWEHRVADSSLIGQCIGLFITHNIDMRRYFNPQNFLKSAIKKAEHFFPQRNIGNPTSGFGEMAPLGQPTSVELGGNATLWGQW